MKPTKSILILLSLFLTFSCDDKEEELPNELSLDWILLKKGVNNSFYVEYDCFTNQYEDWDCNRNSILVDGEDLISVYDTVWLVMNDYTTTDTLFSIKPINKTEIGSCSGYDNCEVNDYYEIYFGGDIVLTNSNIMDCCYEYNYKYIDEYGNELVEKKYRLYIYQLYQYKLYWNKYLDVCYTENCIDEISSNFDVFIPNTLPIGYYPTYLEDYSINPNLYGGMDYYFHPNTHTPIDTNIILGNKNIPLEKLGWLSRNQNHSFENLMYYRNEKHLQMDNENIDISNWKVVDYQRKE